MWGAESVPYLRGEAAPSWRADELTSWRLCGRFPSDDDAEEMNVFKDLAARSQNCLHQQRSERSEWTRTNEEVMCV